MIRVSNIAAGMITVGLVASGACRPEMGDTGESSKTGRTAADKLLIRAVDSLFAAGASAGDADAVASVYATDASLLAPNLPPQKGRDAIKTFWGGLFDAYAVRFEVASETIEGRGDLAYNVGHYRLSAVPKAKGGPGVTDEGKYLAILKKEPDRRWKLVYHMYSSNLPLQH